MLESCLGDGAAGATFTAALQFFAASQCLLQETWPQQSNLLNGSIFDFIVVGAGTAGSVVAARLAELPGKNVLLLEAGGDPPHESIIPGYRDTLKASHFDWNFTTQNDYYSSQALRGGSQRQPRGKMLGGSGSLNDMVYARGFPVDYDEWAEILGDEWSWENVLQYFKKTEHLSDERIVNDPDLYDLHGFGGAIEVSGTNESTFVTDIFLGAFEELGFKVVKDMTNPEAIGVGRFSHTIKDGKRHSSLTAILNEAVKKENIYVVKNANVVKVLIEDDAAVGVSVIIDNELFNYYVAEEVVLSAGAFNTPKILLLSGIGPKEHLDDIGISVVQNLPVGENLHDHVMVLTYLSAEAGTCQTNEREKYMEAIKYLYDRSGALSRTTDIGAYIASDDSKPNIPEFAIYPTYMPVDSSFYNGCFNILGFKAEICEKLVEENRDRELISLAVVRLKPKSRGRVRLKSSDYWEDPLIYSGTFSDETDLEGFPQALDIAWEVSNTTYFKSKNARVIDVGLECTNLKVDDRSKCIAKNTAMSAWHSVGTAAMGSVVDSHLRVKGVKKLRVADASVMPKIIRGNSNAPVVMIAERAADFVKQDVDC